MINLSKYCSVVTWVFIMASIGVVNVQAATNTASLDKMTVYKSGVEGVNGLKDRSIAFYEKHGFLPNIKELLNAPLNDQTQVPLRSSSYLNDHYLVTIFVNPSTYGSCKGIKIQADIANTNNDQSVAENGSQTSLLYTLIALNVNGVWETVCTYSEQGQNANLDSIELDNCYNSYVASQMVKFNDQMQSINVKCFVTK